MPNPEHIAFCRKAATAVLDSKRLPVSEEEILQRVLYETIRRYCAKYPRGFSTLMNAAYSDEAFDNSVGIKLKAIAWDEVIPNLSPNDRANFDRTLRCRQGPRSTRPPSGPRSRTGLRSHRGPGR